jgi:hypothetical protein
MPKRIEVLVLWLVPALAIQVIAMLFADSYAPDLAPIVDSSSEISLANILFRSTIAPLLIYTPNIVTAFWMWKTESAVGGRTTRWTLVSLLLSYWVLIPYIGMYVLWSLEKRDSAPAA